MKLSIEFVLVIITAMFSPCTPQPHPHLRTTAPSVRNWYGIGNWLLEVSDGFEPQGFCPPSVAFPNRKSYFFDNKLEFSVTKLAES